MSNKKVMDWLPDMIEEHEEKKRRSINLKAAREKELENLRLLSLDRASLIEPELSKVKMAYENFLETSLFWYDRAMLDLHKKLGNYRAIEKETGIPFETCYSAVVGIKKRLQSGFLHRTEINSKKKPAPINVDKLRQYLYRKGKARIYKLKLEDTKEVKPVGKKPERDEPYRSAALLTKPGEEKKQIIVKVAHIHVMKSIANIRGISQKQAYTEALEDYAKKWSKILEFES